MVGNLATTGNVGSLAFKNAQTLSVSSITGTNIFMQTIGATSDLTLNAGSILTANGPGNSVILAAGCNFINNAGSGAIALTGPGTPNWQIYSTSPAETRLVVSIARTMPSGERFMVRVFLLMETGLYLQKSVVASQVIRTVSIQPADVKMPEIQVETIPSCSSSSSVSAELVKLMTGISGAGQMALCGCVGGNWFFVSFDLKTTALENHHDLSICPQLRPAGRLHFRDQISEKEFSARF